MATKRPRKRLIDYPRAQRTGWRRWLPSWRLALGSFVVLVVLLVGGLAFAVTTTEIPEPHDMAVAQTTIIYYDDGKTELGRIGEANRISVPLDRVSPDMQHAILAAEDRGFYNHGGFDPRGLTRAFWNNLTGGSTQGASTITQQFAKNAYLSQEQSVSRKFKELVLSVKLETQASKDEILASYLNTIYYGRGAYGVQAASQAYFGKNASKLNLGQSAYLASLIRAPSFYATKEGETELRARWQYVLDGMVEQGWATPEQAASVKFPKPRPWHGATNYFAGTNGYLLDSIRRDMLKLGYTDDEINLNGYRVTSTINKQAQEAAINAVQSYGPTYYTEGLRIGLASVRPGTGEVAAIYGGKNYLKNQLNNADQAMALAGSTFKPFGLAAALEQGVSLYSTWDGNSPRTIDGYTLQNYGNMSFGTVTLLTATEKSINTPYVELGTEIGFKKIMNAAVRAGVPKSTPGLQADPTTVLGTASPTALDMADAYATFAARGLRTEPTFIQEVKTATKEVDYVLDPDPKRAFDENVADTVNYALQKVVQVGTGTTALGLGRPAAGKTGTTDNNRSAWFVGYTPQLATAVMMAKSDKRGNSISLAGTGGMSSVTGGSFPAQMWTSYMQGALEGEPVESFEAPSEGTYGYSPSPTSTGYGYGYSTPTPTPTYTPRPSWSSSPSGTRSSGSTPSGRPTAVSPTGVGGSAGPNGTAPVRATPQDGISNG